MDKSVQITSIIAGAVILLAVIGILAFNNLTSTQTITGNGQSQIKAVPDLVSAYFNVETSGDTAKEAKDKNSEIVDDVITALIKQGFERKDIVTENFNVYPNNVWENNRYVERGYKATHNIKVEFSTSQTDKIGEAIDAGVDAGALISYINFELSVEKQNEYKAIALKQATEDARMKAESIAAGLGKELGSIVSVSDSGFDYYPWQIYRAEISSSAEMAKQATTNIQPGEKDINARVSVVYKIR